MRKREKEREREIGENERVCVLAWEQEIQVLFFHMHGSQLDALSFSLIPRLKKVKKKVFYPVLDQHGR